MKTNKYTWGDRTYELYKPVKNKKKLGLFAGLFGISFIVPMMTTVLLASLKLITKYNPLWLYQ